VCIGGAELGCVCADQVGPFAVAACDSLPDVYEVFYIGEVPALTFYGVGNGT
jgi:hypothetical protein